MIAFFIGWLFGTGMTLLGIGIVRGWQDIRGMLELSRDGSESQVFMDRLMQELDPAHAATDADAEWERLNQPWINRAIRKAFEDAGPPIGGGLWAP